MKHLVLAEPPIRPPRGRPPQRVHRGLVESWHRCHIHHPFRYQIGQQNAAPCSTPAPVFPWQHRRPLFSAQQSSQPVRFAEKRATTAAIRDAFPANSRISIDFPSRDTRKRGSCVSRLIALLRTGKSPVCLVSDLACIEQYPGVCVLPLKGRLTESGCTGVNFQCIDGVVKLRICTWVFAHAPSSSSTQQAESIKPQAVKLRPGFDDGSRAHLTAYLVRCDRCPSVPVENHDSFEFESANSTPIDRVTSERA